MVRKAELKSWSISSLNIMSSFIYTDLISSLLDPRIVDPGSTLIYVGACGRKCHLRIETLYIVTQFVLFLVVIPLFLCLIFLFLSRDGILALRSCLWGMLNAKFINRLIINIRNKKNFFGGKISSVPFSFYSTCGLRDKLPLSTCLSKRI